MPAQSPPNKGFETLFRSPIKSGGATPCDFEAKHLTAYGGLLPIATMLKKLSFGQLVEETLTVPRRTRAMTVYHFVLAMALACRIGFSRLYHLRFLEREPMLTGIPQVRRLLPQCIFWRFLASLHRGVARQVLELQRRMHERLVAQGQSNLVGPGISGGVPKGSSRNFTGRAR